MDKVKEAVKGLKEAFEHFGETDEQFAKDAKTLFHKYDRNQDGTLGVIELQKFLCDLTGKQVTRKAAKKTFFIADENDDNRIDEHEFFLMMAQTYVDEARVKNGRMGNSTPSAYLINKKPESKKTSSKVSKTVSRPGSTSRSRSKSKGRTTIKLGC